jgi:DNA mismatch repair protein MutL
MPPETVDVNVHPTKQEVRFHDGHRLYSQLLSTLRTKFLSSDLTARLRARPAAAAFSPSPQSDQAERAFAAWATGALSAVQDALPESAQWGGGDAPLRVAFTAEDAESAETSEERRYSSFPSSASSASSAVSFDSGRPPSEASARPTRALQLHNAYLVAETDDGMLVIDQHALHERILYEQIRQRVMEGQLESQRLLVPEPVELTPPEAATAVENAELFARLGLMLQPFGGETVLVESYPAMLGALEPARVLRDLVGFMLDRGRAPDKRDLVDELLHMVACKAAVKAGDPLTSEEVSALLEQRHLAHDSHHCPHGRPTALVFTKHELEKQFGRV